MLTPLFIETLFWVGVSLCFYVGVYNLFHQAKLNGLEILLIGPIVLRVFSEFLMVLFSINERLTDLKNLE